MADTVVASNLDPAPGFLGRIFGMFNIFIDPGSAAKYIRLPWSWLWPLLLGGLIIGTCMYQTVPMSLQAMQYEPPNNMSPEQLQKSLPMIEKTQRFMAFFMPVMIGLMTALIAGILSAACAVMDVNSKFRDNYALLTTSGLIGAVGYAAGFLVLKMKGDSIQSMRELRPAFGLDLFMPEGTNRFLLAVLNYFSIFTIWYIIILGLTFACLYKTSKGKGFAVTAPVWMVGILFALIGAIFGGK